MKSTKIDTQRNKVNLQYVPVQGVTRNHTYQLMLILNWEFALFKTQYSLNRCGPDYVIQNYFFHIKPQFCIEVM